jgi:hypothetical protein
MVALNTVFLVVALICFLAAAVNVVSPRVNLIALGLAFWIGSLLLGLVSV